MIERVNSWAYFGLAVGCAAALFSLILQLHALRPDEGALRLSNASLVLSSVHHPGALTSGIPVRLPHDWRDEIPGNDVVWYRFHLHLAVAPDRLWSFYVPALEMTPAAFVNGVAIGGRPHPREPLPRYWNRPVLYSIPSGLLRPGDNQVDVRLQANGPWGRITEVYLGPESELRPHFATRQFWRVTFLNVTTLGSLIIGAFIGVLSLARRESVYRWFAAFALAWHFHNVFVLTVEPPVDNAAWDLAAYLIIGLMVATGSMFTLRFLEIRRPAWERLMLIVVLSGPLVLIPLLWLDVVVFNLAGSVGWVALLLALAIYPVVLMAGAVFRRRDVEVFFLCVCYSLTVLLGINDWLVTSGLGYRHNGMLLQFAAAPTLTTFGIILMRRFVLALKETESLNRELEARVAAKVEEIERTFARNRQLESAQAISRERERIMRDMHDGFGSQLIGTISHLNPLEPRERHLAGELRLALHDMRLMIDSLDDMDNDVVVALGLFRNRIQPQLDAAGLRLHWQIGDLPPVSDLGPERVLHFMRILQEAVTNCVKHAEATSLTVATESAMRVNGRCCVGVRVADDGCGFRSGHLPGRGIANMRYRAAAAQLEIAIVSSAAGTEIRVGFPGREDAGTLA